MRFVYGRNTATIVVGCCLLCVGNVGCHHAFGWKVAHIHRWTVDEGRELSLREDARGNALLTAPDHNYVELWLTLKTGERSMVNERVAHRATVWNEQPIRIASEDLEARSDTDRRRIWIVNRKSRQIIASLDCRSKAATGPDEAPPQWAKLDEGTLLQRRVE